MSLTVLRKADREKMAEKIIALAEKHGATVAEQLDHDREILICLETRRGLCVSFDFDGNSAQPDVFFLHWHMRPDSDARLKLDFAGSVNKYHRRKATDILGSFEAMCSTLLTRLWAIAADSAFDMVEETPHKTETA